MAYYDPLWLQANSTLSDSGYDFTIDSNASSDALWVYRCPTELGDDNVGKQTVHCTLHAQDPPVQFHVTPDDTSWGKVHWYYRDGAYSNEDRNLPSAESAAVDNWLAVTTSDIDALASAFYSAIRQLCG